jgi:uncharacterized protein DUF6880
LVALGEAENAGDRGDDPERRCGQNLVRILSYCFRQGSRMARSKSVTQEDLERLGAPSLAKVLLEHAGSDSVLRKKLGMLMAGTEGAGRLDSELAKRIRTIGRSRSFVDWEKRKGLVQELDHIRSTIGGTLAAQDPKAAAERMWEFIGIADSVLARVGEGVGYLEEVFGEAMVDLGRICAGLPHRNPVAIAHRVLAISEGDGFGSSGALIQHLSEALGPEGRTELRKATEASLASVQKTVVSDSWRLDGHRRHLAHRLALLADLEGDVDGYIAAMRAGDMETVYTADIAERLIAASRPAEALDWLKKPRRPLDDEDTTHIDLEVTALETLGEKDKAQDTRWRYFQKTLNVDYLRDYLKRLLDFEDFEAEQKALAWAAKHRSAETALAFFIAWPNLELADRLLRDRLGEMDGGAYYVLRPAAEALEEKYPVAATRLYRRMVESVLDRGSSKQYPYAARDLQSCIRLADRIPAEDVLEAHATFMARLRKVHGRKYGFWGLMTERQT